MAITLDDKALITLKSYEGLIAAYKKDIEEYQKIMGTMQSLIADKQKKIQDMTDNTVKLVTGSLTPPEPEKKPKPVIAVASELATQPTKPGKTKKSKKGKSAASDLKCLHHPEAPVLDKARQLCATCKWKLINSGLKDYDKDPQVIAYLKGETKEIPSLGQPMCPIHPTVPAYNKTTGLCKACQKKAKELNFSDSKPTEKELEKLRKLD